MGPRSSPYVQAFEDGLRELGYVAGQTVTLEIRAADQKAELLPALATDLVQRQRVDVMVSMTCGRSTEAVRHASRTVPLVVAICGDLPGFGGDVASFARPGGQTTGLTFFGPELSAKRLALVREVQPRLTSVAVLWNPEDQGWDPYWRELRAAAGAVGVTLHAIEVRSPAALDEALAKVTSTQAKAILVLGDPILFWQRALISQFGLRSGLLTVGDAREFAADGALMAYGANLTDMARRASAFVDKILKGARPADLPIERPTKFDLVINLKTAKALGLTIPPSLLARADLVIE